MIPKIRGGKGGDPQNIIKEYTAFPQTAQECGKL